MATVELNKKAPEIDIDDFKGDKFKLSDFKAKNNVLLVLNRGFVWHFCRKHMMQLHQDYDKFAEKGTIIAVIGPEDANAFSTYWEQNNFKFYGIPDKKHLVLDLYDQEVNLFKLGRMPAQMLVDKQGMLKYIHYGHSMKDIPDNCELFELINSLN